MPGFLGCAEHRVVFTHRGGDNSVGALDRSIAELSYTRVLDDTSEAILDVAIGGGDAKCCEILEKLRTWGHEMHVLRDGVEVWCGPIHYITIRNETATIMARDVTSWFDVRKVHTMIDVVNMDLTDIAVLLINDALSVDDPNLLPFLTTTPSGILGARRIDADTIAGEELRELARTGVDFTAVGRRIVVNGEQIVTSPLATLLQDHFLADLEVVERGDIAATDWTVQGSGVTGNASVVDAFYGVIERVAAEDSIRDQTSADVAAATRLAVTYPAPVFVQVPEGAQLAPSAPVTMQELVPGALAQVAIFDYCRTVSQVMRLQEVQVTATPESPDVVAVTLAPVGTIPEDEAL